MKKVLSLATMLCALMAISMPAAGQSFDLHQNDFHEAAEARVSLTIPFGSATPSSKDDTRLELTVRRLERSHQAQWWQSNEQILHETKLGFSFSKDPVFFLNDEEFLSDSERLALGTTETIAIVAVVGLVVLVAVATAECNGGGCVDLSPNQGP